MKYAFRILALLILPAAGLFGCMCVESAAQSAAAVDARQYVGSSAMVFRGKVVELKKLPQHPKMQGRARYAATFQVLEYWGGSPRKRETLYVHSEPCLEWQYDLGKEYLVFAQEQVSKDVQWDDYFVVGWADLFPAGTQMLTPSNPGRCFWTGNVRDASRELSALGRGRKAKRR